jgi:hypothetical protein
MRETFKIGDERVFKSYDGCYTIVNDCDNKFRDKNKMEQIKMTIDKIKEVIKRYDNFFKDYSYGNDIESKRFLHCSTMLSKMLAYLDEGRIEKTFRHLGFIQGVLWISGYCTIEDLKKHNMPNKPSVKATGKENIDQWKKIIN